ncbi:MAG TPA: acyl-CoA dehydrogenase family protein [Thermodesulfobacteriota bacterium]|nr:acyl-CoA dehydrogenase family protein [Thermodesulfobacteriota bacterium]
MNFALSEEQKMIQAMCRDFAAGELAPQAARLDETKDRTILRANLKRMADLGLMGMNIPEDYGGAQVGVVSYSLAMTEIGAGCASTAVTMSVTNMVNEVLLEFGSDVLKRKYISRICSGEFPAGAFGLTEPGAGSDPAGMKTTAVLDGDSWVLNGQKIFISSAEYAGIVIVWAVTNRYSPKGRGISAFVVEQGTPGYIIGADEKKMGQRGSSTNQLIFDQCRIPKENLLGMEDDGYRIALMELAGGRIGIGSMAIGIGRAAMDYAVAYAKSREQFGHPIAEFQALQFMMADAYTELEAAQLMILRAAFLKENRRPFTREASMGKVLASEAANRACYKALQILGGYGYTADYPVERLTRDVRVTTIYEGTSEIQRLVIARSLLAGQLTLS